MGTKPKPAQSFRRRAAGALYRSLFTRLSYGGIAGAYVFFSLSLTPSLLPRSWLLQGILSGITTVIGYGLGSLLSSLTRLVIRNRRPRPITRQRAWRGLFIIGSAVAFVFFINADNWQRQVRKLMGLPEQYAYHAVAMVMTAVIIGYGLLLLARLVRLLGRWINSQLFRVVPRKFAPLIGCALTALVVLWLVQSFVVHSFVRYINNVSSVTNDRTTPSVHKPVSAYVTGGPGSNIDWKTLGKKGRDFTGRTPLKEQITAFSGQPAKDPIRVYAGLESAGSLDGEARAAVRELERTGAFRRQVVAVITSTGTGWVDQNVAESLEYMYNGDTALVSMQYSYLPSWLSFLSDKVAAAQSAKALITAVRAKLDALPPAGRPKLLLFGESLGSFGTESTFTGINDMRSKIDGALFVGPPFANPIHNSVTARRDPGTPVWLPTYDRGRAVRFAISPEDFNKPGPVWQTPRVAYYQHASDPIVWISPSLLYHKPEWLQGERGPDVSQYMRYIPVVTFWQVLIDLAIAGNVPAGHGHVYGTKVADGWAAVAAPHGWTAADTHRLHVLIDSHNN